MISQQAQLVIPAALHALDSASRGGKAGIQHSAALDTGFRRRDENITAYIRSKIPAAPMPVPTHMVTMPYLSLRRRRACTVVAARMAPVAPNGCQTGEDYQ